MKATHQNKNIALVIGILKQFRIAQYIFKVLKQFRALLYFWVKSTIK